MPTILKNTSRNGKVTSSQCYRLMGAPKPRNTYTQEIKWERKLKRSIDTGGGTKDAVWGIFLEPVVHDLLGFGYETHGQDTIQHPTIAHWAGSPDCTNKDEKVVADIKCYQPKNFCKYVDTLSLGMDAWKYEFEKEYWQLVSNAILTNSDFIEAIVYMPYEKDLEALRERAAGMDDEPWKYRFIYELPKEQLAVLPDDSGYKDLNIFRFEVRQEDKIALTEAIMALEPILVPYPLVK